jgi:cytosine/adenosine deaminase-related metal-dependent hydrolase
VAAVIVEGCAVATVDPAGTEHAHGHIVIRDGRIVAVGAGPVPQLDGALDGDVRRVDGRGCLATPGFVNTHHHLYQWLTRGYEPDGTLFEWLTALYPVWTHLDSELEYAGACAGLAALALSRAARRPWITTTSFLGPAATCWRPRSRPRAGSGCASNRPAAR